MAALVITIRRRATHFRNGKPCKFETQFDPWDTKLEETLVHFMTGVGGRPFSHRSICEGSNKSLKWKRTTKVELVTCPLCIMWLAMHAASDFRRTRKKVRKERVMEAADRLAGRFAS